MKYFRIFILLASIIFLRSQSYGQSILDGKIYAINLTLKGVHDSFDTLMFQGGRLTYSTARRYGFAPAEYKTKEKNTGRMVGTALNESKTNGTMLWNFVVLEDSISGSATFDSRVRNPVTYEFTGKEIKSE